MNHARKHPSNIYHCHQQVLSSHLVYDRFLQSFQRAPLFSRTKNKLVNFHSAHFRQILIWKEILKIINIYAFSRLGASCFLEEKLSHLHFHNLKGNVPWWKALYRTAMETVEVLRPFCRALIYLKFLSHFLAQCNCKPELLTSCKELLYFCLELLLFLYMFAEVYVRCSDIAFLFASIFFAGNPTCKSRERSWNQPIWEPWIFDNELQALFLPATPCNACHIISLRTPGQKKEVNKFTASFILIRFLVFYQRIKFNNFSQLNYCYIRKTLRMLFSRSDNCAICTNFCMHLDFRIFLPLHILPAFWRELYNFFWEIRSNVLVFEKSHHFGAAPSNSVYLPSGISMLPSETWYLQNRSHVCLKTCQSTVEVCPR